MMLCRLDMSGFTYVAIAAIIPMMTAASDGITAYLRKDAKLEATEVLLLRSAPAAVLLAAYCVVTTGNVNVVKSGEALFAAVLCGFVPLWLLCTGLGHSALQSFASWLCIVPAIAFFATLHLRWEQNGHPIQIAGAVLILVTMFASSIGVTKIVCSRLRVSG
jgi:hypothetical protein